MATSPARKPACLANKAPQEASSATLELDLVVPGRGALGIATISEPEADSPTLELSDFSGRKLLLAWEKVRGRASLSSGPEVGSARFDRTGFRWEKDPVWLKLEAEFEDLLACVPSVMDALASSHPPKPKLPSMLESCKPSDTEAPRWGEPGCGGAHCRGFAFAWSASWCSEEAAQDMHVCCWNFWCIGCCRCLHCDSACLIGDGYLCFCGQSGWSCTAPPQV